ncbi:MAG: APC family permease [bacterium]|jgi:amino acid transporter|nr:APC family permease [Caldisericota bacterium]
MGEETVVFARRASGLVRELSWWDVLLFTLAGPAASGMTYYTVKVPGLYPGGNIVLAFLVGLIIWIFPVIVLAIFASSFPRSGSLYVVISRVLHPLFGFIPNWTYVLGGGAALAVGFLNYLGLIPIASSLQVAGQITKHASLVAIGESLADPWIRLWIALGLTVIIWFLELLGLSRLKWVLRVLIYLPLIVTAIAIIAFFVGSGTQAFDSVYGAGMYDKVNSLANDLDIAGSMMSPGEALQGMLLSVLWAYTAAEAVSFVGSEVKTPRKSFLRGMLIGIVAVGLLYILNAWAVQVAFSGDFIRNYSWLYYNQTDQLQSLLGVTPAAPSIPFYASLIMGSSTFAIIFGIGYFLWYLNTSMIIWMAGVRGIFAMAFDRLLPTKLTEVNRKGAPTWANHLIGIFALLGVFIGLGDSLGAALSSVMLAIEDFTCMFFIWPLGLAAMFLPFTRPDLFEKSTFQYKIFGFPWVSVLGAITFGVGFWIMLTVGLELTNIWSQIGVALFILVGLIFVAYMYRRNRKEGIDPTKIFTEIPPA